MLTGVDSGVGWRHGPVRQSIHTKDTMLPTWEVGPNGLGRLTRW